MRDESLYSMYLFPYDRIKRDSEIVIWGAGMLGREYIRQINETEYCRIKCIVDRNWIDMAGKLPPYEVIAPEKIVDFKDKTVVVAITDKRAAEAILQYLYSNGFEQENVVWVMRLSAPHWNILRRKNTYFSSDDDMIDHFGNEYVEGLKRIKKALCVSRVTGKKMVRIGKKYDGGYAMVDDFVSEPGIAYSFGISSDVSWDRDMVNRGYNVFMYDHTINGLPESNDGFHFFKTGIADHENHNDQVRELIYLINQNGHSTREGMVLKMDVEGCEYGFLRMVDTRQLKQFDQIVMELHDLHQNDGSTTSYEKIDAIRKLTKTHQPVHVHANNYGAVIWAGNHAYPETLEVTFVRRDKYCFDQLYGGIMLPDVDMPCNPNETEINLGNWNEI